MDQTSGPNDQPLERAEKPVEGAEAIAAYLFGDSTKKRRVYYLAEKTALPLYRMGSTLCLRPSAYKSWIKNQEDRALVNTKRDA
jgi:hypothetical protein